MTDVVKMIQITKELFSGMRDATPEERREVGDYIRSRSVDTGINFYDMLEGESKLKGLCAVCSRNEDCDTAQRSLNITSCGDFILQKGYNQHLTDRKKGVWIQNTVGETLMQTCSVCGENYSASKKFMQFCPNCGSQMDFHKSMDLVSRSEAVFRIKKAFELGESYCDEQSIVGIINSLTSHKSCEGCKHKDKWKDEVEYRYNSPCTNCMRRVHDNYDGE